MKFLVPFLAAILLSAAPVRADVGNANVCVLLVVGVNGVSSSVQRSCDGENVQNIGKKKNLFLEELSYQLSSLYSYGLRLINCQVNNLGNQAEYICVVAR